MTTSNPVFAHHGEQISEGPTLDEVKAWPATVDVTTAARALGIAPSTAYEWIRTGDFPTQVISVRRRHRVITAGLVRLLSETGGGNAA